MVPHSGVSPNNCPIMSFFTFQDTASDSSPYPSFRKSLWNRSLSTAQWLASPHPTSASVTRRSPFQLRAPQDVLLPVHHDREVLVFSLLNGVGASGDGSHLSKLQRITWRWYVMWPRHTLAESRVGGVEGQRLICTDLRHTTVFQTVLKF